MSKISPPPGISPPPEGVGLTEWLAAHQLADLIDEDDLRRIARVSDNYTDACLSILALIVLDEQKKFRWRVERGPGEHVDHYGDSHSGHSALVCVASIGTTVVVDGGVVVYREQCSAEEGKKAAEEYVRRIW